MKSRYRIIEDDFNGHEVQVKRWWFPFLWSQCWNEGPANTFPTLDEAKRFAEAKAKGIPWRNGKAKKRKVITEYSDSST